MSQACLRDLTGGSFFTDASTADTNCAIQPLHTAQLSPPLNTSIREDTPVSSLRAQEKSFSQLASRRTIVKNMARSTGDGDERVLLDYWTGDVFGVHSRGSLGCEYAAQ